MDRSTAASETVGDTLVIAGTSGDDTINVVVTAEMSTGTRGTVTGSRVDADALSEARRDGDTLDYSGTTEAVTVDLCAPSATGFASIAGVENVTGGSGDDTLTGDGGANALERRRRRRTPLTGGAESTRSRAARTVGERW